MADQDTSEKNERKAITCFHQTACAGKGGKGSNVHVEPDGTKWIGCAALDALKKQLDEAKSMIQTLDKPTAWTCILCGQSYSIPYVVGVDGKRSHARCWAKNFYRDEKAEEDLALARAEIVHLKDILAKLESERRCEDEKEP